MEGRDVVAHDVLVFEEHPLADPGELLEGGDEAARGHQGIQDAQVSLVSGNSILESIIEGSNRNNPCGQMPSGSKGAPCV